MENQQGYFSRKLRAGKKRSYFFDVRSTKQGDYFVTITETKRRFDKPGYDSHKIFLYKEDFKTFQNSLKETLDHIKTELNPEFDYENYDRNVYIAQVEKDKLENPEKYQQNERNNQTNSDYNSKKIVSEVRSGNYLDKYEGKEVEKLDDSKNIENNDTNDADAMNW